MMDNKLILVLMGGWNSEKEVSIRTGESVYETMKNMGYNVKKLIFSRNIAKDLEVIKPDIVFNALHGQYAEDGRLQGLLDILNIPYTHSGLLASALCMDKIFTNRICKSIGVKIPKSGILEKNSQENQKIIDEIGNSFVIKPNNDGSSVGVEVILDKNNFDIEKYEWKYSDKMIIEEYVKGQELQVAIINDKATGVLEVRPKKLFFDYECKYTSGMTDYVIPAPISEEKYQEALDISQKIHDYFGCRGISRAEFILSQKDNQLYFLEINTHPGFTATSLVPKIAKHHGIKFEEIIEYLINSAKCGI